ncbi:SDR family oxidoreductase [Sphingomonas sp. BAUL-RG-20F-R05-02]|uniref:SDR family oxidoreductase n=1 Tax=Sphingomonas sp. BAUL-RG-20F-R05-02 TaxID=2914830 RepID=UPI001F5802D4|nr:SDR family oxidoreductase [Sphingomonas sp. BAUL-RG-20F-R05-02]
MGRDLSGTVAVITGASAGIGEAIARDFAEAGVRLLLVARRADRLAALAESLPVAVETLAIDVAEPVSAQRMLDTALARFGRVDALINNAGIFRVGTVDSFDLDALGPMIALNYEAVVRASYVFARAMKAQGGGAIVNISSIGANLTTAAAGVYGGLKRAVEIFSDSLRVDLAGTGVRVGIVAPGTTATEVFDHLPAASRPGAGSPVTPLLPADVAAAVRFLLEQPEHANIPHLRIYSSGQQH